MWLWSAKDHVELGHEDYSFAISLPTGSLLPCRQTFPNPAKTPCAGEKSLQADLKFYLPWHVRRPESPRPLLTRVYTRAAESSGRGKYKGYAILLVGHCFCHLFLLCLYGNGRRGGQGFRVWSHFPDPSKRANLFAPICLHNTGGKKDL